MITTIRRMTIEKGVRAYALSTTNSCGNRGGISYRYRTKNLRQCDTGLCLANLCSAGRRYSICELPDGEIKRRVPRVAWRNHKTRSLRRPKEKTGKAKKKRKHQRRGRKCFLAISMWRLWRIAGGCGNKDRDKVIIARVLRFLRAASPLLPSI